MKRFIYTWLNKLRVKSVGGKIFINGFSVLSKNTKLGDNCHFNGMRIRGGGEVIIGNNFHSGSGCKIITSYHDYDNDDYVPYGNKVIHKSVVIGNNVWVGDDVLILGGVNIEDGAILQAGAVVTGDIGYCEIAGGSPAKCFKKRNIQHYERLVKQGKFH